MRVTALHDLHIQAGARMTEFEGWEVPLYYGSILDEVKAVRQQAGLFDVSHMGRLEVTGLDSLRLLQHLTTNDVGRLDVGRGHYNLMCNADGGVIDDLTIFRTDQNGYLLVVNAANTAKDMEWITSNASGSVSIANVTMETALSALQGPASPGVLSAVAGVDLSDLSRFACGEVSIDGADCFVCRAGYTGEIGYEFRSTTTDAALVWQSLLVAGAFPQVTPCGLGARDVLRIEAGFVLYGNEIGEDIDPITAGLSRFVRMDKGQFVGRSALASILEKGPQSHMVGVRMTDRTVPRPGAPIVVNDEMIGVITSGTFSPTITRGIALGYVKADRSQAGLEVEVILRENPHTGLIVKPPFYK